MKTLQNNFTTPEQSKRLLELGVPRRSADEYRDQKGYRHSLEGILDVELFFQNFPDHLPCWSVGRLMEIFELCTSSKFERIKTRCSVLTDILWQIEIYVTETSKGFCIDFSKLEG